MSQKTKEELEKEIKQMYLKISSAYEIKTEKRLYRELDKLIDQVEKLK